MKLSLLAVTPTVRAQFLLIVHCESVCVCVCVCVWRCVNAWDVWFECVCLYKNYIAVTGFYIRSFIIYVSQGNNFFI